PNAPPSGTKCVSHLRSGASRLKFSHGLTTFVRSARGETRLRPVPRQVPASAAMTAPGTAPVDVRGAGPEVAVETFLRLLERALVCTGGQILPRGVGDDEGDVSALPGTLGLACHRHGRVQGSPGRNAGEDALLVQQLPCPLERGVGGDREAGGQHRLVVEL